MGVTASMRTSTSPSPPSAIFDQIRATLSCVSFRSAGRDIGRELALDSLAALLDRRGEHGVVLVGNGGSASIAQHIAVDLVTQARVKALSPTADAVLATAATNDYGPVDSFARVVRLVANRGDVLVAMSCSGRSRNIIEAVREAIRACIPVVALSGFDADNPLRALGAAIDVHVESHEYGAVQVAHLAVLHAAVDAIAARRLA